MKALIIAILIALIFIVGIEIVEAEEVVPNKNANSHVVFYVPHQDDDTLTMGVGIMNHYYNGHNVHIVMLTDGAASAVRKSTGLSTLGFTAARNKEFAHAMGAIGITPDRIAYSNLKDGATTVSQIESVMLEYEAKYPGAKHKTYSYTDSHVDHRNAGQALRNLTKRGKITDARFYVRRGTTAPPGISLATEVFHEKYRPFLMAASASYNIRNEVNGFYGIGHRSVRESFRTFEIQPQSRYHK